MCVREIHILRVESRAIPRRYLAGMVEYPPPELGARLTVGQQTLDLYVEVRILRPQPFDKTPGVSETPGGCFNLAASRELERARDALIFPSSRRWPLAAWAEPVSPFSRFPDHQDRCRDENGRVGPAE